LNDFEALTLLSVQSRINANKQTMTADVDKISKLTNQFSKKFKNQNLVLA